MRQLDRTAGRDGLGRAARDSPLAPWLRIEQAALLVVAIALYRQGDGSWGLFALLFFGPDLAALGYIAGSRIGATAYNLVHTLTAPAALAIAGVLAGTPLAVSIATIWFAHIAMDRLVGYGLKDPSATPAGAAPGRIPSDRRSGRWRPVRGAHV